MDKEGKSAKRLLMCVDTSNSVIGSGDYLRRIVANVAEIVTKLGIKYINVIQFADGVYRDTEFGGLTPPPADKFGIKVSTGGTNYDKVFEYIDSNYVDKKVHIDKNIITACGAGQTFNFSFEILRQLGINPENIKKSMQI